MDPIRKWVTPSVLLAIDKSDAADASEHYRCNERREKLLTFGQLLAVLTLETKSDQLALVVGLLQDSLLTERWRVVDLVFLQIEPDSVYVMKPIPSQVGMDKDRESALGGMG
jgi:hypothetical protein